MYVFTFCVSKKRSDKFQFWRRQKRVNINSTVGIRRASNEAASKARSYLVQSGLDIYAITRWIFWRDSVWRRTRSIQRVFARKTLEWKIFWKRENCLQAVCVCNIPVRTVTYVPARPVSYIALCSRLDFEWFLERGKEEVPRRKRLNIFFSWEESSNNNNHNNNNEIR